MVPKTFCFVFLPKQKVPGTQKYRCPTRTFVYPIPLKNRAVTKSRRMSDFRLSRLLCHRLRCRRTFLLRYNRILLVLAFSGAVTTEISAVRRTAARYATHTAGVANAGAAPVECVASAVNPRSPTVFNSFNRAGTVRVFSRQFAQGSKGINVAASQSGFYFPSTSFTFFTCFQRCTSPMLTSGRSTQ